MISIADLNLPALLPELFLLGAICALMLGDLFVAPARRGLTHFAAICILVFTALLTVRPHAGGSVEAFGGMFLRDGLADLCKLAITLITVAVLVYAKPSLRARALFQGEFYILVLFAVLGSMFLVSAGNLLTVYLGLELLSLSTYALVALDRDAPLSSEAAMKYFVLGALASGMLLYGMSMVYGATGSLDLEAISARLALPADGTLLAFGLVFIVVGIAFKFGAAPFHMWVPDVYQGSPTAVTLFVASAPEVAAFGMAYRLLEGAFAPMLAQWQAMLAIVIVLSLALGNLVAIAQVNLKRMLAYSTISHVGFLLMGLANGTADGYAAALFYAVTYALTTVAAFGLVVLLSRAGFEADAIDDFRGLARRSPWYALMMLMVMASMAGVPIWVGFIAKFAVLKAALDAGMLWLALAGAVFTVIGAFYYLRVIKVMYFDEPKELDRLPLPNDLPFRWLLSVNAVALLGLGLFGGPLLAWCRAALG